MDAVVKSFISGSTPAAVQRPSREEAEAAVRTLIRWAGDDPAREGLQDTPRRVTKAFGEFFSGYEEDAAHVLTQFDALASLKPAAARANYVCKDPDDQVFIDLALAYQTLLLSKDRAVLAMTRRLARLGVVVCGDWLALAQAAGL